MAEEFDAIVIGSGFGGAIAACRLAEAGYKVLILERGQRWNKTNYPSATGRNWVWSNDHPGRSHGWVDFRKFGTMSVITAAGVGGGSLIYGDVLTEAPFDAFDIGWPKEINHRELTPHYHRVGHFMNVQEIPVSQENSRTRLALTNRNFEARKLELGISFDPGINCDPDYPDRLIQSPGTFVNPQGVTQGFCWHKGDCEIGCPVDAKNTLAFNYIPWAEKHGAQVEELSLATNIEQVKNGFRVTAERISKWRTTVVDYEARIVVLGAGSLGSTELLLRCRDVTKTLPLIGSSLGQRWSNNGFLFVPVFYHDKRLPSSTGPTISVALSGSSPEGESFLIEDGGFPRVLADMLMSWAQTPPKGDWTKIVHQTVRKCLSELRLSVSGSSNMMLWLAQGQNRGNGVLCLREGRLDLNWDMGDSLPLMRTMIEAIRALADESGGEVIVPFANSDPSLSITPHPLGGCCMGDNPDSGVVNHRGEAYGYSGLYVLDGATVPGSIGANPARTIAALAERNIEKLIKGETNASEGIKGNNIAISLLGPNISAKDVQGVSSQRDRTKVPEPANHPKDAEYVVWYGTTRRLNDPSDVSRGYSAERDKTIHYGTCRVFVPKSHKIGSVGSTWWKRLLTLSDDRLKLKEIRLTSEDLHWQEINNQMMSVAPEDRHALVFVHGYNVSFEQAALRAAQIGFDLSIRGAMGFFSWPSQGTVGGYLADAATIEVNEDAIRDYLTSFALRSGARIVHVIAHSMGNRAVLRAVARIAESAQRLSGVRFGQFFLAAADVDAEKFRQLCNAYQRICKRATLYVSTRDLAVEASRWLQHYPRVGLMPPVTIADGLDTINVTNVDLTLLGHGYIAEARDVLVDMHSLIRHDMPPDQRFGLRPATSEDGKQYWLIGA